MLAYFRHTVRPSANCGATLTLTVTFELKFVTLFFSRFGERSHRFWLLAFLFSTNIMTPKLVQSIRFVFFSKSVINAAKS